MAARKVMVVGAPGLNDFKASVVPGLDRVPVADEREHLAVVFDEGGELFVIPADRLEDLKG